MYLFFRIIGRYYSWTYKGSAFKCAGSCLCERTNWKYKCGWLSERVQIYRVNENKPVSVNLKDCEKALLRNYLLTKKKLLHWIFVTCSKITRWSLTLIWLGESLTGLVDVGDLRENWISLFHLLAHSGVQENINSDSIKPVDCSQGAPDNGVQDGV